VRQSRTMAQERAVDNAGRKGSLEGDSWQKPADTFPDRNLMFVISRADDCKEA
jgi:hypothetical protein